MAEPGEAHDQMAQIGISLWLAMLTTHQIGHASPVGTLYYTKEVSSGWPALIQDFVAWCSQPDMRPGCEERIRDLIAANEPLNRQLIEWSHAHRSDRPGLAGRVHGWGGVGVREQDTDPSQSAERPG